MSRLYLGDCFQELRRIPSDHVDLVLTDPPYGMGYQSPKRKLLFAKIANDNRLDRVPAFASECFRVLKPNTHLYMFCNDYAVGIFREHLRDAGFNVKRTLVWVKNEHSAGDCFGDYANKTEFVIFAHKGRRFLNGGRDNNILRFNRVMRSDHPTPKPVDLCQYLISKSTSPGEMVLDPFMGVGATVVAAHSLGREYLGIEIESSHFDVAQARLADPPAAVAA